MAPWKLPEDNMVVSSRDLIPIDTIKGKRKYLKELVLVRHEPRDFKVATFDETFTLSDFWMKKIYDATSSQQQKPEKFTETQLKYLNQWLRKRKMVGKQVNLPRIRNKTPVDTIIETLAASDLEYVRLVKFGKCHKEESREDVPEVIPCYKHKIQPESKICEQVMKKMQNISKDEEMYYQKLLSDEDFRKCLDENVARYLKGRRN